MRYPYRAGVSGSPRLVHELDDHHALVAHARGDHARCHELDLSRQASRPPRPSRPAPPAPPTPTPAPAAADLEARTKAIIANARRVVGIRQLETTGSTLEARVLARCVADPGFTVEAARDDLGRAQRYWELRQRGHLVGPEWDEADALEHEFGKVLAPTAVDETEVECALAVVARIGG